MTEKEESHANDLAVEDTCYNFDGPVCETAGDEVYFRSILLLYFIGTKHNHGLTSIFVAAISQV